MMDDVESYFKISWHKNPLANGLTDNTIEHESDLIVPYSNHFEHLKGDRKSECSIIINDQWRICFRFENENVYDAGIEDYH